jgi:DNA (cytosine-5)-methyltransferase 1
MGYYRAGFDVIGVDIEPQPHYPSTFIRGDAIEIGRALIRKSRFVAIHASPPCKGHSAIRHTIRPGARRKHGHVDHIPATRRLLHESGLPYVIENVPGAPLLEPVTLCGSMFPGVFVRRHRLFELGRWSLPQPACDHRGQADRSPGFTVTRYHSGHPVKRVSSVAAVYGGGAGGGPGEVAGWRQAMGIDWMVRDELSQAIPPAYTEHVGAQLLDHIGAERVTA